MKVDFEIRNMILFQTILYIKNLARMLSIYIPFCEGMASMEYIWISNFGVRGYDLQTINSYFPFKQGLETFGKLLNEKFVGNELKKKLYRLFHIK